MQIITALLVLIHASLSFAELDSHQRKGLDDTKELLRNKSERNKFINGDKSAKAADDKVEALTGGGANKDEVYGISAEVMDKLTKSANGDPVKMQEILGEAAKNPEAFYDKYFDDSAKARVRGVAGKIGSPDVKAPR